MTKEVSRFYSQELCVRLVDEGPGKYASPQALSNYLEEMGGIHASHLSCGLEDLKELQLTWVLVKVAIDYKEALVAGDVFQLNTHAVGGFGLSFRRDFWINKADGSEALRAVSFWVLMNTETRKIEKIPEWLRSLGQVESTQDIKTENIQIPKLSTPLESGEFQVRLSDIDQNFHINNVRYLDFIQEASMNYFSLPLKDYAQKKMKRLEIMYRAEGFFGDSLLVLTQNEDEHTLLHSIVNKKTQQELVRARVEW